MTRAREIHTRPFPSSRRLVTAAQRAGSHAAPMHGLLDLDVTDAVHLLEQHDPPLSFSAFVVAAVGRAVAAHAEVHAYRNWRGQLVVHRHVDVSTIVEISTPQGPFPMVHTMRDADIRDVTDLTVELHRVKTQPFRRHPRASRWALTVATRIPGRIRVGYALVARSTRVRQRAGTVGVTAVGMFADGGGFAIAPLTLMSLQVVIGGITERPRVVNGAIESRRVLDLTVTINHNIVDGAPATRFGAELRHEIEQAIPLRVGRASRHVRTSIPARWLGGRQQGPCAPWS